MRKLSVISWLTIIATLFCAHTVRGAVPLRVDVQSMTIEFGRYSEDTSYHVYATDEAGTPVTIHGVGAYVLGFNSLEPFAAPNTFDTNRFNSAGLAFGTVATGGADWQVFSSHSDPLNLWATNTPRKPILFSRTGSAGFHAAFHYVGAPGYEVYDDDVVLEGTYQVDLGNAYWLNGRQLAFYRLFFDLKKPE
jgi:hypothetical protein